MQYHFDIAKTDFGKFFILDSRKGLHFILKNTDKRVPVLKSIYKPKKKLFNGRILENFIDATLGKSTSLMPKIEFLVGTNLQKKVWSYLRKIPKGKKISYSELATKISKKNAVRAIASAVGKNPVAVIIPCHRIISKDGSLGGYAWGLKMKSALLDVELGGMADSIYRGGK